MICKHSLPFCSLALHFIDGSLAVQKLPSLIHAHLSILGFIACASKVLSKTGLPVRVSCDVFQYFPLEISQYKVIDLES